MEASWEYSSAHSRWIGLAEQALFIPFVAKREPIIPELFFALSAALFYNGFRFVSAAK